MGILNDDEDDGEAFKSCSQVHPGLCSTKHAEFLTTAASISYFLFICLQALPQEAWEFFVLGCATIMLKTSTIQFCAMLSYMNKNMVLLVLRRFELVVREGQACQAGGLEFPFTTRLLFKK